MFVVLTSTITSPWVTGNPDCDLKAVGMIV